LGIWQKLARFRAISARPFQTVARDRVKRAISIAIFRIRLWCPKTVHKMNSGTETDWVLATQVVGFACCRTPLIPWQTHFAGAVAKGNTLINRDDAILRLR
jgi:hypothetical protein